MEQLNIGLHDTLGARLRRGVMAGLAAGVVSAGFGYWFAEPLLDRAVSLEASREAAMAHSGAAMTMSAEPFTRHAQHVGFGLSVLATAVALGVLFAVAHAGFQRRDQVPWRNAWKLAGSMFFAIYLVPFVRYPANPPGVGDPGTLDTRTSGYLAALAVGIAGVLLAHLVARDARTRGWHRPVRDSAVGCVLVATVALTAVLPDNPDPLTIPAGLLWQFRLTALGTAMLLWAVLGATFGALGERAIRRAPHPSGP